jgi:hypothetical protein
LRIAFIVLIYSDSLEIFGFKTTEFGQETIVFSGCQGLRKPEVGRLIAILFI